jgi:hypothetical protein
MLVIGLIKEGCEQALVYRLATDRLDVRTVAELTPALIMGGVCVSSPL